MHVIHKESVRCDSCRARVNIDKEDVKLMKCRYKSDVGLLLPKYKITNYNIAYVRCPVCNCRIDLWSENVSDE